MVQIAIPNLLKNFKEKIKDRFYPKDDFLVKKEIIIVDPKRNTRSMRTQDLKYSDVSYDRREIKKWYVAREVNTT